MKCDCCSSENKESRQFCHSCGSPLPQICSECAFLNEPEAQYCGDCGKPLGTTNPANTQRFVPARIPVPEHLVDKIKHSQASMEGERKQVTVLFADMQNYTPLAERLGEEILYGIMNRVYQRMMNAVHQHQGTVQELTGDGILALFGAPIALEDAPLRASRAALEIQQQMSELGTEIETECGEHPRVRIGIHTGTVVVGTLGSDLRMEFKAVGDTVNMASRLESIAEPGTILISEVTHRLVNAFVDSRFDRDQKLKGITNSQRCYKLLALKETTERFDAALQLGLTPLAGFDQELQILKECLLKAQQDSVRMVNIVGEAGSGKSRLLYEFKQSLQTEEVQILEMHCSSYGRSTAFYPVIGLLKTMFQLHKQLAQQDMQVQVEQGLNKLGLEPRTLPPLLLNLLGVAVPANSLRGLDAEIIGAQTRDVLKQIFEAFCHDTMTIILVEDLHWLDSATEELLNNLMSTVPESASLIVASYRPEYMPPWAGEQRVTKLELSPLSGDHSSRLVRHCLGSLAKSEGLVQSVVRKVEGNPLFAEEMSRYIQDTASTEQANKSVTDADGGIDGLLPESLRDVIMARIDRLEQQPRILLQVMSVIGREFSSDLLRQLRKNNELPNLISTLKNTGLINQLEQGNKATFYFKHILIQEAIYNSLLENKRTMLHEKVAQALETIYLKHHSEYAESLAYHWKKSTQPNKAIPYLAMAGEKNLGVYTLEEANQWFKQAIEQIDESADYVDDTLLADVLLNWARVHYYRKDFKALIQILQAHLQRIESLGDQRRFSLTLFWLGFAYYFAGHYDTSRVMLNRALKLGKQLDDIECIGYACLGLMFIGLNVEKENTADSFEQLGNQLLAAANQLSDIYLESKHYLCMAIHNIYQGRFSDAEQSCLRIRQIGERAGDPRAVAMSHWSLGCVNLFQEQFEEAINNADATEEHSPDPLDQLMARMIKGVSLALMGEPKQGLLILQKVRSEMIDSDYLAPLLGIDISYGAAMVLAGEMRAGVRWIQETIDRFTRWGNLSQPVFGKLVLGEIYLQMALGEEKPPLRILIRNLGFILLTLPVAARKARHYLEQAVDESRQLDLPATLARALLDLALLNKKQKHTDEARACLLEASAVAKPQAAELYAKITRELQQFPTSQIHS